MTTPTILITHDGNDITTKVLTYERSKNICTGVGNLSLTVEWKTGVNIQSWDTIVLRESGRRKGTYFVSETNKSATKGAMDVTCQDGSLKLTSYFITDIYNINYETYARYWIEKFLTEATIDYEFADDSQGALLSENFPLGPASAFDTIQSLLQASAWYMYFDGDNTCHIGSLNVDLGSVDKTIRDHQITHLGTKKDDKMLRNRAVVWGNYDSDGGGWVFADVTQHTPWDRSMNDIRTIVLANSNVRNTATAYNLAMRLLSEFTKLTFVKELELAGEHNLDIGDVIKLNSQYHKGNCLVTSIGSRASSSGLITLVTLDQRCPRLFGYVVYLDYVYVGTNGGGVWRKPLDSNAWESFSTGLSYWDVTDLIIKNGIYACVAKDSNGFGWCFTNFGHTADWQIYFPLSVTDLNGISYPLESYEAVAVDIDDYSNTILIGYRLKPGVIAEGESKSWVYEIDVDHGLISNRQVFIIDQDHQDFRLVDVEKYGAERLCTAEAPFSYAPDDPQFWGDRKVYKIYDPEPKAKVYGPPPECEYIDDPFWPQEEIYIGSFYEDSTMIIEGDAISSFWSATSRTNFTYDYFLNDTRYNIGQPIIWPLTYGTPFGADNYLFARVVYRKSFEALSEVSAVEDRQYHVCDIVKTTTELVLHHFIVSPLVFGYPYQIENAVCATTGNIILSGEQMIDGISAEVGDRVLVKDQTDPKENGIYIVAVGAWARSLVTVPTEDLQNSMFVSVDSGTVNSWTAWQIEADDFVEVGIDDINFVRVLEITSSTTVAIGSTTEFYSGLPAGINYQTNMSRIPRMRDGIIYYLYDGHQNVNDNPSNPFSGYGKHLFNIFKYNILGGGSSKEKFYEYAYQTNFGTYVTTNPSLRAYSETELIPSGNGVAFAFFIFEKYPVWEAKGHLANFAFDAVSTTAQTVQQIWAVPEGYAPGGTCSPVIDSALIKFNQMAWSGTAMAGENSDLTSYLKYHVVFLYEILYPCCLTQGDAFASIETQIEGIMELRSGELVQSLQGFRGWNIVACTKDFLSDSFDYVELNHNYAAIEPLYIRDGVPNYRYTQWSIYNATAFASAGPLGYLNHTGLMSPHQDDFDQSIYLYDDPLIYKESIGGTTLATLNAEELFHPTAIYTKFLVTNGYFILLSQGYRQKIDAMFYGKLKNEYLFPGKDLCYLLKERKTESVIRGLDYEIKDHDFYDLNLENSQEYPIAAITSGESLVIYSGCDGVVYSGGAPHLKWYNVDLNQTTLAGSFNDVRVFSVADSFYAEGGSMAHGKYIGLADGSGYTFSMIPAESISIDDFVVLVTLSGFAGNLETSNGFYPYIFTSISGVGFYQRNPGSGLFVDYSPGGLFGEIQVIRIDDRV